MKAFTLFFLSFLFSVLTFADEAKPALEKIVLAGGCFWCMEPPFDKLDGVKSTISGYMGGATKNPTYKQISTGATGHTEVVLVEFDPAKIKLSQILDVFWRNIHPTQVNRQFVDKGSQYRSGIFYFNYKQKAEAEASKQRLLAVQKYDEPIATEITKATEFYRAEERHQDYYKKNPRRYKLYRLHSGRDQYLEKRWGKKKK